MPNNTNRMDLMARSYDRYAPILVPCYDEIQTQLLVRLMARPEDPRLVVDLGAGSGIFLQRVCLFFPEVQVVWVDQSPEMRAVAEERLHPWGGRVRYIEAALQDPWQEALSGRPDAIVSMSAIHHLEDAEKEELYRRCCAALAPGGCFYNADEVQAPTPEAYRQAMLDWDGYVTGLIEAGQMDEVMAGIWAAWRQRNLGPEAPKHSGDDCHATVASQLEMLRRVGFADTSEVWSRGIWSMFGGRWEGQDPPPPAFQDV
jgi:tRNA (cmo5U34)-methyltransferase